MFPLLQCYHEPLESPLKLSELDELLESLDHEPPESPLDHELPESLFDHEPLSKLDEPPESLFDHEPLSKLDEPPESLFESQDWAACIPAAMPMLVVRSSE